MATGTLGTADLAAATDTTLYTVPAGTFSVCAVSFCNRGGTPAAIRLSVSASGTPSNAEYLEYDALVPANGVLERTGIVVEAGKLLVVRSSAINVTAVAMGIETTTA